MGENTTRLQASAVTGRTALRLITEAPNPPRVVPSSESPHSVTVGVLARYSRPRREPVETVRPRGLTTGIALLVLISLDGFVPFPIPEGEERPPSFIIWGSVVLGVLGLIAAFGLWQRRRWALWPAIVVLALGILSSVPGISFAPSTPLRVLSGLGVIAGAAALAARL